MILSFWPATVGTYLGIDIAIKEVRRAALLSCRLQRRRTSWADLYPLDCPRTQVLPSTDYEVAKYFEREWRIMRCEPTCPGLVRTSRRQLTRSIAMTSSSEARHPNVVQVSR
jgi:hypothetical protein